METKYFLHQLIKHTNTFQPLPGKIDYSEFPKQVSEKVGTKEVLTFIDGRLVPGNFNLDSHGYYAEYPNREFTQEFTVARYDVQEDYHDAVAIYISDLGDVMVTQKDKILCNLITPDEMDHLIGMPVKPEYKDRSATREAYIFAIQALDPSFGIIIEYLDDQTYRLVLDTELYYEYDPDDIYIPEGKPDIKKIRRKLLEGRAPYNG